MKTVADVLDAMLDLYAKPGAWIHDGLARDAAGQAVPGDSPDAVAWSVEGALVRAIGDWEAPDLDLSESLHRQRLLCDASEACGVDLSAFGDTARHQGVVVAILRMGLDGLATGSRDRAAA